MAKLILFLTYIMYGKKFYRRRPRKYLRRRKTASKRRATVSSRIRRYVKQAIHRNIENKERVNYAANQSITCGDRNTMTWPLLIATTQGTSEEGRIGNSIKVVKGQWNMMVNILPYNATTNPTPLPCWVKLWIVKDMRLRAQQTSIDALNFAEFFRYGSTPTAFQNSPLDLVAQVNTDAFRVLHTRTFKIGQSAANTALGTPMGGWNDNSPFSKHIVLNWGKYAKGVLKYDEAATTCANNNLYLVIQAVAADGTSTTNKTLIEMHYNNVMRFEDA